MEIEVQTAVDAETLDEEFFEELEALVDQRELELQARQTFILPMETVILKRFKQFKNLAVTFSPEITLMAGPNNAGKSTLLHALAVWEFCKLATLMERGRDGIGPSRVGIQGFGMGDDEFSPINIPSLKHMWTNLKPQQKDPGEDGYTLQIGCQWSTSIGEKFLTFALSLANDRLFIKVDKSNLDQADRVPQVAYLPPFAGISAHEERVSGATRRRRIGEGLAGAVLRNLLLDMHQVNTAKRLDLQHRSAQDNPTAKRIRIKEKDLETLRSTDPWEIIQKNLREVFGAELSVSDFHEEYHSYIQVLVSKGEMHNGKFKVFNNYTKRDLMVEGSGFLQWVSVFVLAVDPNVDVLLLDEPDAHLHPHLQKELVRRLGELVSGTGKQIFIGTHSSEIIRQADPSKIMGFKRGSSPKYLTTNSQKVGMLEGIGSHYSPRFDRIRQTGRVFFHEGSSDISILQMLAIERGTPLDDSWIPWATTRTQQERKQLWLALQEEIPKLQAVSLRDRDCSNVGTVGEDLDDLEVPSSQGFRTVKWRRRHIESYLIVPEAISAASGKSVTEVKETLLEKHALSLNSDYPVSNAPSVYLELRGKELLKEEYGLTGPEVARYIAGLHICEDIATVIDLLQ